MNTVLLEPKSGFSGVCVGCYLGEDAKLAAALAQSLFSRPRERRPPRGRRRRAMAVEALVPPDAVRVATRIAARITTRIAARGATVYTNAPEQLREDVSADLCTLLRPHGCSRDPHVATVYTNVPKRRREAILADLCTLLCPWGQANSFCCSRIRVDAHPHDRLVRPRPNRPRMGEVTRLTQRTDYLCAKTHTPAQARPERHEQRDDGGNPRPQGHLKEVRQSNRRKVVR